LISYCELIVSMLSILLILILSSFSFSPISSDCDKLAAGAIADSNGVGAGGKEAIADDSKGGVGADGKEAIADDSKGGAGADGKEATADDSKGGAGADCDKGAGTDGKGIEADGKIEFELIIMQVVRNKFIKV
jgi:hypothetical protein